MKAILALTLLVTCLTANAKTVTISIDSNNLTNSVTIGTNEVAEMKTYFDNSSLDGTAVISVFKDGRRFNIPGSRFLNTSVAGRRDPVFIAGPAIISLVYSSEPSVGNSAFITVEITPEAFPPGLTVILPEGTIGIIHVESSTNLLQWRDEWVSTFANTNQNRFFRIRADRSLP